MEKEIRAKFFSIDDWLAAMKVIGREIDIRIYGCIENKKAVYYIEFNPPNHKWHDGAAF